MVHVVPGVKWRWQLRVSCYYFWRHVLVLVCLSEKPTSKSNSCNRPLCHADQRSSVAEPWRPRCRACLARQCRSSPSPKQQLLPQPDSRPDGGAARRLMSSPKELLPLQPAAPRDEPQHRHPQLKSQLYDVHPYRMTRRDATSALMHRFRLTRSSPHRRRRRRPRRRRPTLQH